jgi:hypothetical protein
VRVAVPRRGLLAVVPAEAGRRPLGAVPAAGAGPREPARQARAASRGRAGVAWPRQALREEGERAREQPGPARRGPVRLGQVRPEWRGAVPVAARAGFVAARAGFVAARAGFVAARAGFVAARAGPGVAAGPAAAAAPAPARLHLGCRGAGRHGAARGRAHRSPSDQPARPGPAPRPHRASAQARRQGQAAGAYGGMAAP